MVGEGTPSKITLDILKSNCTEFGALDRSVTICLKNCHNRQDYDIEMFVNTIMSSSPVTEQRLTEIAHEQSKNEICKQLIQYCQSGWPNKHQVPQSLKPYYSVSVELTIQQ